MHIKVDKRLSESPLSSIGDSITLLMFWGKKIIDENQYISDIELLFPSPPILNLSSEMLFMLFS